MQNNFEISNAANLNGQNEGGHDVTLATERGENTKATVPTGTHPNPTLDDLADEFIASLARGGGVVEQTKQPMCIAPHLLVKRGESNGLNGIRNGPDTEMPESGHEMVSPKTLSGVSAQSGLQDNQTGSSSSKVPTAKGAVPQVAPRRVQPIRKARQTARDRVSKDIADGQNSELSVSEANSLITKKQQPAKRAFHAPPNAKPNVGPAPIPEFVQGSSRSPLVGAKRTTGPSPRAVTGEGPNAKRTARPAKNQKSRARQPGAGLGASANVAIWGSHKGEDAKDQYVFGGSPLFGHWVAGLDSIKFPKKNLRKVRKGESCKLRAVDGKGICGWINPDGHFLRHFYHHLRDEVAFWTHCPACSKLFSVGRDDSLKRHAKSCANKHGIPSEELFKDARNNVFLHLPRTAALERLASKQRKERKPSTKREGLWLPTETELYIRTVTARARANARKADRESAKRKRLDEEEPSARPSKKRK